MGCLVDDHPELVAQWDYEKNHDSSPEDYTSGSSKKVWWVCKNGHEWQARISHRCNGIGCPYCSGKKAISGINDLATVNPELAAQWHPTKNGDLMPQDVLPMSNKKVWWQCNKGHEWEALICNRNVGRGCPICSNKQVLQGFNDLETIKPKLASEWHPTLNGNLMPCDVVPGSNKKVWWQCEHGHEWEAIISDRSNGAGCPICSGKKTKSGINDLATINPDLAAQWHPTKNGNLTPDQVTTGSRRKVWWVCEHGHEWEATIYDRRNGSGCPICSNKYVLIGDNDLATTHPELAAQWHPTKNGNLTPEQVTASSNKKVWWQGKCGHEWEATIGSRKAGNGCPICAGKQVLVGFNDLATINPNLAAQWHPTKNGNLTPHDVTAGSDKKVWWQCAHGHEWEATIYSRNSGRGCPYCFAEIHTSFPEQAILYYLGQITTVKSRSKINGEIEIDIFLPDLNAGIEYDGWRWHANVKSQKKEEQKDAHLEQLGIRLIRIKEVSRKQSIPPDTENIIYCCYKSDYSYLIDVIHKITQYLDLPALTDVDPERDKTIIWDQYIILAKENSLASVYPDLAAEWHPTKNGNLTPEQVSFSSDKRVWWQCKYGHEWQATIDQRSKSGCPICSGHQVLAGFNDLATVNPELATEWHPTKNGTLTPNQVVNTSHKKVWWLGSCGHEWEATVANRSYGQTCPICLGKKVLVGFNDLATVNPELAAEWHPTKNGSLTPDQVTAGSDKKVWWLGKCGHEWEATISHRYHECGCPICAGKQVLAGFNDLATLNPELAVQWHPTKNGNLTPKDVRLGSEKKVWWLGKCGHEWEAAISDRSAGKGCPICAGQKVLPGYNDLATLNPELAAQWHPTKNGNLTPDQVTTGSGRKVWWICEHGHEWEAKIANRNKGYGCPECHYGHF